MWAGPQACLKGGDFVVQSLPLAIEDVRAGDDDVDLRGAGFHRTANLLDALGERREAGGKSSGDGGDGDAGSLQRFDRGFNEGVIDADGGDGEVKLFDAEALDQMALQRIAGLGAQPPYAVGGIVAAERGQVHAGNGAKQPRRLILFLDGAARAVRGRPALDRAGVDPDLVDPVDIERDALVAFEKRGR